MNDAIKQVIVAVFVGAILGASGAVFALDARYDSRYLSATEFKNFSDTYTFDKKMEYAEKVRELQRELEQDPNNEFMQEQLEQYKDQLCLLDPAHRLCKVA